jgi:hypothetical protein
VEANCFAKFASFQVVPDQKQDNPRKRERERERERDREIEGKSESERECGGRVAPVVRNHAPSSRAEATNGPEQLT